ncbi:oleosin-B6 isoform X8 [Drosophila serrata]|uniref:oleosin-B6 isoform X8 n=1 Tax=Drosophila serrata TaxID=7274 RepID=UPI000A1CFDDA|nr:oleosin-B6 isoform X8 [Drosophila serrata]
MGIGFGTFALVGVIVFVTICLLSKLYNHSKRNNQQRYTDTTTVVTIETNVDRQGNVFSAEERPNNRYGDIFFIEPGSDEANRIRDQLEKDEKDLPSYDEVMRMCNLTTPTAAAAAGAPVTVPPLQSPLGDPAAPISIAALPAPPYSETDPHSPVAGAATVITMEPIEPSTSRAAQIPTSPASAAAPAAGYQRPETSIVLGANVTSV